jgi:hypothetical protein
MPSETVMSRVELMNKNSRELEFLDTYEFNFILSTFKEAHSIEKLLSQIIQESLHE